MENFMMDKYLRDLGFEVVGGARYIKQPPPNEITYSRRRKGPSVSFLLLPNEKVQIHMFVNASGDYYGHSYNIICRLNFEEIKKILENIVCFYVLCVVDGYYTMYFKNYADIADVTNIYEYIYQYLAEGGVKDFKICKIFQYGIEYKEYTFDEDPYYCTAYYAYRKTQQILRNLRGKIQIEEEYSISGVSREFEKKLQLTSENRWDEFIRWTYAPSVENPDCIHIFKEDRIVTDIEKEKAEIKKKFLDLVRNPTEENLKILDDCASFTYEIILTNFHKKMQLRIMPAEILPKDKYFVTVEMWQMDINEGRDPDLERLTDDEVVYFSQEMMPFHETTIEFLRTYLEKEMLERVPDSVPDEPPCEIDFGDITKEMIL